MVCEKCWYDAAFRSAINGRSVADNYSALLVERIINPCTEEEQSGEAFNKTNTNGSTKTSAVEN